MDKTPQQLLAIAKKILAELQSLNDNLQKQSEAITENGQPTKHEINVTPEVHALLQFPESVQNDKKAADARNHWYQKTNLIFAGLTFIALVAYAITTVYIYSATRKAADAAKVSADAAKQAAEAAEESNRITKESLTSIQRAFIVFSPTMEITNVVKDGKIIKWSPAIPVVNRGNTPARQMRDRVNVKFSRQPLSDTFNFPDDGPPWPTILGPQDAILIWPNAIPIDNIREVQKEAAHLYIYGWASYEDIFKAPHITQFCYEMFVDPLSDVSAFDSSRFIRLRLCHQHNCSDEDCKTQ